MKEEHVIKCYEDLRSKRDRVGRIDQGLDGTVNLAKLRFGDWTDHGSGDDKILKDAFSTRFTIPIDDDILSENGAVCPNGLQNSHLTILNINSPENVLV